MFDATVIVKSHQKQGRLATFVSYVLCARWTSGEAVTIKFVTAMFV
jgi:hypothetical protein